MRICDYGCGQEAKYYFPTVDKWCCSKRHTQCQSIKDKISKTTEGYKHSEEAKEKIGQASKDRTPWNKGKKYNRKITKKFRNKNILTIEKIKRKYPTFFKEEELRYNPIKSIEENEIQVHCKNHTCLNSKERGGWFTPTKNQIHHRISSIEKAKGIGESNFYCSKKCKDTCPLYRSQGIEPSKNINLLYTEAEKQTFRQFVLERDNYQCQYCENKATIVHHERPQKLEPLFVLDPDFAWSCCEACHYKYGHKTGSECSTGNLAKIVCN